MIPIIAAAATLTVAVGVAAYKYFSEDKKTEVDEPRSLGEFVIWGRPNVGKTIFISQIRGEKLCGKSATSHKTVYSNVNLEPFVGEPVCIKKIVDMPGTSDRVGNWLEMILTDAHVFYMFDTSRLGDKDYVALIRKDLTSTVDALRNAKKEKRVHIIGTHVDQSKWKDLMSDANMGNCIQEDDDIRYIYEALNCSGVAGYFYFANLTEETSFKKLVRSIVNDCHA